jgi:predicted regulator of Ras-like GTPase activity (Roadblock/LC7/MglB family)
MAVASKPLKGQPQIGSKAATPESAKSAPVTEPKPDAPVAKIKMLEPVVPAAAPDAPVELEMAKPAEAPVAPKEPAKVESSKAVADATSDKPSQNGARNALQTAFDTDEDVDAKTVVAHVVKLAGVKGCAIMFNDGLGLAGNLPGEFQAEGLCALGPSFLKRLEDHMAATKLGSLRAVTLSCAKAAITFFMHDNLCLAALHAKEELAADVRERLARAVHELSEKYSHPA